MDRLWTYYSGFQTVRGRFGGLPQWARAVVLLAAIPGIALAFLSVLAFLVSILALLLLTVPVYRLMQVVAGSSGSSTPISEGESGGAGSVFDAPPMTGPRKRVESTVIDPAPGVDET
jgi:hypothetical protein